MTPWASLALVLAIAGCAAGVPAKGPEQVLQQYAHAIKAGDARAAYALLSEDAKASIRFEAFERMLKENPDELRGLAEALSRPSESLHVTAVVTAPSGESLELVFEDGAWRAGLSAVDLYSQSSPRATMHAFVRAYEARRYDVLMRFVPTAKLDGLDEKKLKEAWEGEQKEEMRQLVSALKVALPTAQVERLGTRATLSYGAGGSVQLVEEDGVWKVEEF